MTVKKQYSFKDLVQLLGEPLWVPDRSLLKREWIAERRVLTVNHSEVARNQDYGRPGVGYTNVLGYVVFPLALPLGLEKVTAITYPLTFA